MPLCECTHTEEQDKYVVISHQTLIPMLCVERVKGRLVGRVSAIENVSESIKQRKENADINRR